MKPCRNREEFTNNIAALALLIDQLNIKEMKKTVKGKEGSINILQDFMIENVKDFPSELTSNFRDIMTLRSKKFPIHVTDPKFVETVVKLLGKYPPNWSELWLKTLEIYKESLNELSKCLGTKLKNSSTNPS